MRKVSALILDSNRLSGLTLSKILELAGMPKPLLCTELDEALAALDTQRYDIVFYSPSDSEPEPVFERKVQQKLMLPLVYGLGQVLPAFADKHFITKPYEPARVEQVVKDCLEKWRRWQAALALLEVHPVVDLLCDALGIGFCLNDQEGCFLRVNENYAQAYGGFEPQRIIGQHFNLFLDAQLHEEATKYYNAYQGDLLLAEPSRWEITDYHGQKRPTSIFNANIRSIQTGEVYRSTMVVEMDTLAPKQGLISQFRKNLLQMQKLQHQIHQLTQTAFPGATALNTSAQLQDLIQTNRLRLWCLMAAESYSHSENGFVDLIPYLRTLVHEIEISYPRPHVHPQCYWPESLGLDFTQALSFGVLLQELYSNSLRHGFEPHEKGLVELRLEVEADNLCLFIKDNGRGLGSPLEAFRYSSLGFQLVRAICHQFGASYQLQEHLGLSWFIKWPLNRGEAQKGQAPL